MLAKKVKEVGDGLKYLIQRAKENEIMDMARKLWDRMKCSP